jgi:hypothetical protein
MAPQRSTTTMGASIEIIDGLHVPYSIDDSDPDRPGIVAYWGYGYATAEEAAEAIRTTEAGEDTPPGVRVDMGTGRVVSDLPARLRRALDARGCTIAEAARLAGMPRQNVHRLVTGGNPDPRVSTLGRLMTAIGATLGELFADGE